MSEVPARSRSRKRNQSSTEKLQPVSKRTPHSIVPKVLFDTDNSEQCTAQSSENMSATDTSGGGAQPTTVESQLALLHKEVTNMSNLFQNQFKELNNKLDECYNHVKTMKDQLSEACEAINSLELQAQKIPLLESEIEELKKQNELLSDKILQQEVYSRRENLIFEKVNETKKGEDTTELIHTKLAKAGLDKFRFQRCHRLGRFDKNKTRPIIVRFVIFQDKISVLKKREELRKEGIIIHDDFPAEISESRNILRPIFSYMKHQGKDAVLIRNKLRFNDQLYGVDQITQIPYDLTGMSQKITEKYVFFAGEHSCLSNFYGCEINANDKTFKGSEQLYQYEKFKFHNDTNGADKVLACKTNRDAWKESTKLRANDTWEKQKAYDALKRAAQLKFDQVPKFRDFVLENKNKTFVEATQNSKWGIGLPIYSDDILDAKKWKGQNLFGKIILSLVT